MRIRFLKDWSGRRKGSTEDNPDPVLCARWRARDAVEFVEPEPEPEPEPVADRAIPSPAGRQPRRSGRGKG